MGSFLCALILLRPGESKKQSKKRGLDLPSGSGAQGEGPGGGLADQENMKGKLAIGAKAAIANAFKKAEASAGLTSSTLMLKTPKDCRHLIK